VISEADQRVKAWAGQVLGDDKVVLGPPVEAGGVRLHLLEIKPEPVSREVKRSRLNVSLKYLVTASFEPIEKAHQALGDLLIAAMQFSEFEVDREPPPASLWQAFGVPPQPSFSIRVQVSKDVPQPAAPVVRKAVFDTIPTRPLQGVVIGPEGTPIYGAFVEYPGSGASCETDHNGRFILSMAPANAKNLLVRAKGREQKVDLGAGPWDSPVTIHLNLED
jgi:hypothetical protein